MFKAGDKVWSFEFGWGVIESTNYTKSYPVLVRFDSDKVNRYTSDGKLYTEGNRTLFFEEFSPPESALKRSRWRAEKGECYYMLNGFGQIIINRESKLDGADICFKHGNYFKTEEEAKESKFYKVFHEEE